MIAAPDPGFAPNEGSADGRLSELVVCSLEPWDEIWRRNQFFADALLKRDPKLRILFVEPPADVLFDLWNRRFPTFPRLRRLSLDGRLRAFRPLKLLPRRLGRVTDSALLFQLLVAVRAAGFKRPTLWINDVTYAPLLARTRWPSVYDITDDWLLAPFAPREVERLRRLDEIALNQANEVVVCSPALAASRGATRDDIWLVPNGVDLEHFRQAQPRPADLPRDPTAVYVGSLHDARLDVELVVDLALALPHLNLVFVGPDSLSTHSRKLLEACPNILLLGPRPYGVVPAYLQHASVVIVPHLVSAFTESLDPIKAYECLALRTPTVATPVAGFREHSGPLNVVARDAFPDRVADVLSGRASTHGDGAPISWAERARSFESALARATTSAPPRSYAFRAAALSATRATVRREA